MLRLLKLAAMAKHDTGNEQPPDKRIAAAILVYETTSDYQLNSLLSAGTEQLTSGRRDGKEN